MPTWLVVALSILYAMWSVLEIGALITVVKHPHLRYTKTSARVTLAWVASLIFGACFLISRLFA